jgi:hypothetical protein
MSGDGVVEITVGDVQSLVALQQLDEWVDYDVKRDRREFGQYVVKRF